MRQKKISNKFLLPIMLFVLCFCYLSITPQAASKNDLKIHFISVGEGDGILLQSGGENMVIDFGYAYNYHKLKSYLNQKGIKNLKYAMLTHAHYDHMGGMPTFLKDFTPQTVFMPLPQSTRPMYHECLDICKSKGYPVVYPKNGQVYNLGSAKIHIVSTGTHNAKAKNLNETCIVVRVTHGKNSFLLLADCNSTEEKLIMKGKQKYKADVVKIAHHGAKSGTSKTFLKKIKAKHAVISVGKENKVHHPNGNKLKMIHKLGLKMYRTDSQGTIIATSNGKTIKWNKKPTKNFKGR